MKSKLKAMAEALGYGGSEIFPKQTEILVERGDTGNFLNLPQLNLIFFFQIPLIIRFLQNMCCSFENFH